MKQGRSHKDRRRALVSDHAIVRYIERVIGAPEMIDQIVDDLLADGREAVIPKLRTDAHLKVAGRMELTVSGGRVITVVSLRKEK